MHLINYEYFEGKKYDECSRLEKAILSEMIYTNDIRVIDPHVPKGSYEFNIVIFLKDQDGYQLETEITDTSKCIKLLSEPITTHNVLALTDTPFKVYHGSDDNELGSVFPIS